MSRSTRITFVLALTLLPMWLIWQGLTYNSSATTTVTPWVSVTDYPVVVFPGQPATVTVAWGNIPTDGRYKLRVQLENKFQEPHVFYFPLDITSYNASETRTVTLSIPVGASPRVASRFVAAFLSTTVEWGDVLAADLCPQDVTIESSPPTGWTSGGFRLGQPDAKTFLDPQGRSFYVQGMTYAYEEVTDTLTAASVISELARMKELGFNTVNLYPRSGFNTPSTVQSDFLPEILSWADHNRMAVYVRVWYNPWVEFPDYMDPQYRDQARHSLDAALTLIRPHPSALAVDLDQRWLLDVSWSGVRRYGVPRLMTQTLAYLPTWLQVRYGNVTALNTAWDRHYITFADVLSDTDIVRNRQVVDLDRHPWRLDLVEYTLWAMDDFMKEVIAYARSVDPHHLFTYTNDRAEVIPFPRSTRSSSGIDFISPVHYNFWNDFYRDWMSRAKLTYETLWQRDLYGLAPFVRESGWRTTPLSQTPPLTDYAWSLSESHKAELYLRQATLLAVYPWTAGWAYFKWYDKPEEGDFGYLNDDGTLRPVAQLGRCINQAVQVNQAGPSQPRRWVYYPPYALTTPYPAYEQYKTLVELLEHDFYTAYEERVAETWNRVTWPIGDCAPITNTRLFTDLAQVFAQRWRPYAFTSTVPADDQIILLAGQALETLSQPDRATLAGKRTVTFGPVGINDERYHLTTPWYAQATGAALAPDQTVMPSWPGAEPAVRILSYPITAYAGHSLDVSVAWRNLPVTASQSYKLIVQIENWDIPPGLYYRSEVSEFGPAGALTVTLDVDPDRSLTSTQPLTGARYVAAFISKTVEWGAPALAIDATAKRIAIQPQRWVTVTTPLGLCPAWTAWVARPLTGTYRIMATFHGGELNGQPAVVQSVDGRHTAFLYDALSWKAAQSDADRLQIEASLACHSRLLDWLPFPFQVYLPLTLKQAP